MLQRQVKATGTADYPGGKGVRNNSSVCDSISPDIRDSDLADLAEGVAGAQIIEAAAISRIAGEACADAELGIVFAVVDQLPSVGALHPPDQLAVEKQLV